MCPNKRVCLVRYIVVDLEATCWETGQTPDRMEIIEIGAVSLPAATQPYDSEFQSFVRPVAEPQLSDFCRKLTTIDQASIDAAPTFSIVFNQFLSWMGETPMTLCSWGAYDLEQFRTDCRRHGIAFPSQLGRHVNLKAEYSRLFHTKRAGMAAALKQQKLTITGTHHRGIDDARNIARLANIILPKWEQHVGT